jgi:hypothetical protein
MNTLEEMTDQLSSLHSRHNSFKGIFNTFQDSINHLESATFLVKGITLDSATEDKTVISYIGRTYEITFSSCMVNTALKGKISISRVLNNSEICEVSSITFNGQSVVDVKQPKDEDPMSLAEDGCCLNLVLNWIFSDLNE